MTAGLLYVIGRCFSDFSVIVSSLRAAFTGWGNGGQIPFLYL